MVAALLAGFGIAGLSRRFSDNVRGIQRLSYGIIFFIFGWGLIGLQHQISDFFSLVIGPILLLFTLLIFNQAIHLFQGRAYDTGKGYGLVAFTGAINVVFTFIFPSSIIRLLSGSFSAFILLFNCGLSLVWKQPQPPVASNKIMASGFFGLAFTTLLSVFYAMIFNPGFDSIFVNSPENGISILGYILGMLTVIIGFSFMIHDKHQLVLEKLTTHDELTGVYNRRTIMEFLKVSSANSRRNSTPLSVLMIDLDEFKQVNDQHGHMEGDVVLEVVAQTLASVMRENDMLGRYGGEEFLAVLPNTDLEGARALAERVRAVVDKKGFVSAGNPLSLTASVGVAYESVVAESGEKLLQRADEALMGAKIKGRNLVVIAD